jgi:O-antigen/teichoic acid export membrane protein
LTEKPEKSKDSKKQTFERNMLDTAKGGSFLAMGTLFALGSRFAIAFFLARLLGAEQYGIYDLAISAATLIASIATMGLDSTMVRYVAIQVSNRDDSGVWGTIQIGVGFSFLASSLMSIGLYFLAGPIAVGLFNEPRLVPFFQLFSVIIPFMTLSSVMVDVARGFKRMDYSALAQNGVLFTTRMILIGILALIRLDAFTAVIAFGLSELAVSISLFILLKKQFSLNKAFSQARREYREIFTFALPFWMSGILTKFRKNIQTLLLGTFNTVTSVGIFSIASKINLAGHIVYQSIIASVKPVLAELDEGKNWDQMERLYQTTTRWTFMANLPIFLIMAIYPEQLLSIFGRSFTSGALALIVLALGELINAGTGICGSIIDMTGRTKLKLANAIFWVLLISVSNVLLIPRWGVLGAAVSSSLSISAVNLLRVLQVWILYRILPYNRTFIKPITAGSAAAFGALLLRWLLPEDGNFLLIIVQILVLGFVYIGVTLLLGVLPEERIVLVKLYKRVFSLLSKIQVRINRLLAAKLGSNS